ncbi:hypothetical protein GWI33_005307 [Rhynchophorus ferrugineus]|uniref:Uncharacterized protein n=1 Tax=Rhynchophorus ferrugineus TaxID=354439 RepID=A0A834IND5_RHYFE|nr:hypothetical protein GWI33_005307 [Rhynchophorus ferrugineus]
MSTEDCERSGRPKEFVTDENIKITHKMILNYGKLKLNEIAHSLEISTERVHHFSHKYLGNRELCANWVLRELTFDQKQQRVSQICPSNYFLFSDLKRMLAGKKFSSNEQAID